MEEAKPIVIDLDIPSDPDEISGYIKKVIDLLTEYTPVGIALERKIKMILVELVTNSIKHSTDVNGSIKFTINHPNITIQKVDKGLKIEFTQQSLPFKEVNKTIKVSFSEQNNHQIKILDPYKFKFLDPYKEEITLDYLPEHFGLYIITLASDSFIYQYDPESNENSFIVLLNI